MLQEYNDNSQQILIDIYMDNCTVDCIQIYGHLNLDQMCTFTQQQCIQDTVQFIQAYFCVIRQSFIIMIVLSAALFYILFSLINFVNDNYLTKTVEQVIDKFKISPSLAGVTFLAFANGAPDVLTAIIAGSSDSASTALIPFGSIFGACLFSTAFILSSVIFCQPNSILHIEKKKILIPLGFYLSGMLILILSSAIYKKMNVGIALSLVILYIIFIFIQFRSQHKLRKQLKMKLLHETNQQITLSSTGSMPKTETLNSEEKESSMIQESIQVAEQEKSSSAIDAVNESLDHFYEKLFCYFIPPYSKEQWTSPPKIIISLLLSPFGLAFTQTMPDVFSKMIFTDSDGNGGVPLFFLMSIPAILLLAFSVYKIVKKQTPENMKIFTIYSFLVVIGWISLFCSILINLIELIQLLTKINSVFLGLTVLAWANCLGDYLSVTKFAKLGNAQTAVAGIFSGQLFNFLIGFGISLVIQSISNGTYEFNIFRFEGDSTYVIISDSIILLVIASGFIYLVFMFYKVLKQSGSLNERDGKVSRSYYIIFLLLALLLSIIADFFYEISCDISIFGMRSRKLF